MVDITDKKNTLRFASAEAIIIVSNKQTIRAIQKKIVPKGDVFEVSRAAGLLGVKKTSELLPDCHPLPIEFADFEFKIEGLKISICCRLKTIYKTGIEVEAMHGASIAALNIYDMLKPIDNGVEIRTIRLLTKKGGKGDRHSLIAKINCSVIVCSDTFSKGLKEDTAGIKVIETLENWDIKIENYEIVSDDIEKIQSLLKKQIKEKIFLIIFVGGTGLSPRDQTPEAVTPFLERRIPGIEEAIRKYGQDRTPYAALSRSVVGMIGNSLVLTLPGSTKGAIQSLNAIFPEAFHIFDIVKGSQH